MKADAEVSRIDDKNMYSISQLATVYGMSRDTVSKRLTRAGVDVAGERRTHPVYHIADASRAIVNADKEAPDTDYDPETLPPKERLDWFRSEREKDSLLLSRETLVTYDENSRAIVDVIKMFLQPLETIGDTMEREKILSVDALERFEGIVDDIREDLADKLESYELRKPE